MNISTRLKNSTKTKGFTLVEVLVVMAIIATLLGVGVGGIKSMATSKGVSTAVPLAESVFKHAREIAKSTGTETLVVVYADDSGSNQDTRDRYLRMMGVAQTVNGATRLITRPVTLPSNTYYNNKLSGNKSLEAGKAIFPGSTDSKDCYTYGFNSEGYSTDDPDSSRTFVVQAGKLRPGDNVPDNDSNNSRDIGGFKIWPSGKTALFRSPNQIIDESEDADF